MSVSFCNIECFKWRFDYNKAIRKDRYIKSNRHTDPSNIGFFISFCNRYWLNNLNCDRLIPRWPLDSVSDRICWYTWHPFKYQSTSRIFSSLYFHMDIYGFGLRLVEGYSRLSKVVKNAIGFNQQRWLTKFYISRLIAKLFKEILKNIFITIQNCFWNGSRVQGWGRFRQRKFTVIEMLC